MCCKKCCPKYIEPRLDGEREDLKVGYQPVRLEKFAREELLKTWKQDTELRAALIADSGDEGGDNPMSARYQDREKAKAAKMKRNQKRKLVLQRHNLSGDSTELRDMMAENAKEFHEELEEEITGTSPKHNNNVRRDKEAAMLDDEVVRRGSVVLLGDRASLVGGGVGFGSGLELTVEEEERRIL